MVDAGLPKKINMERWHEVRAADGTVRPLYGKLVSKLGALPPSSLRMFEDRMSATLREMGVTFNIMHGDPWGREPWRCDLLPQLIAGAEWDLIVRGFRQRLRAWEAFLKDIYGGREILRAGAVPVQAVLGSPNYQHASIGLAPPRDAYLHLTGLCLSRDHHGTLQVKQHHSAPATGIPYMLQNRRALARVAPELFEELAVQPLAESPLLILEQLRQAAMGSGGEPRVVLLSPGEGSAISSEQSFLARRMGIPMVQGGDLLVLDDALYLKTVRGLERVDVVYNCIPDAWLDPLTFRRDSLLGVPGLVHCLRKGSTALINAVGSQIADDRSLLAFANSIIRFYLNEPAILPTVPTLWLGDIDQRELALDALDVWRIRPMHRERVATAWEQAVFANDDTLRAEVRKQPALFIAQPRDEGATTVCFEGGKMQEYPQDHIVFGMRTGTTFDVLPGALTRVHACSDAAGEFGWNWTSKDTWVLTDAASARWIPKLGRRVVETSVVARQVTSRVAESFYWMGRYLERAHHQAYLISVVETLETEELNSAERKHYRPMWNRLLPPLDKSAGTSRRSISNWLDRYRLVLLPEPGSVLRTFQRAVANAEAVQDSISPEAWATINELRARLQRTRFREGISEAAAVRVTRRTADAATQLIPQFFAIAANTMLADDGWSFCEIGKMLERAVITANSVLSVSESLAAEQSARSPDASEIELSAFLRLLGTRDAYRRIYQMRAEPIPVLELLWQHPQVPRSVRHCLEKCDELLRNAIVSERSTTSNAPAAFASLIQRIKRIDWAAFVPLPRDEDRVERRDGRHGTARPQELGPLLKGLLNETLDLHMLIADCFLNHQAHIAQFSQPRLQGL